MSHSFLTMSEAEDFLARNPSVAWIDVFMFDTNGIARGKRCRRDDLRGVVRNGISMPSSIFAIGIRGNCVAETGRLWETGDPDIRYRILSGTLKPVPVGEGQVAQAVLAVDGHEDLDPSGILAAQVKRLAELDLTPNVAVELEFYLTSGQTDGAFRLKAPRGVSAHPEFSMTYQFEELNSVRRLIDDIYTIAAAQDLPVDALIQESGPGQFEINLRHEPDPLAAALHGLLLKRAVRAACEAHGMEATFMPKPHHDWAGSGMHVHVSLVDSEGRNIFSGDPVSPACRHAIGGLQATMPDFMAIWAQSGNAYKRYVARSYVAPAANWGLNNRMVALRIPYSNAEATRIEHRVSGADANPYLVIAAILAGIRHGLVERIEPGPMAVGEGDTDCLQTPLLPNTWTSALEAFEGSVFIQSSMGSAFQKAYARLKESDRRDFERIVTATDYNWYARLA